MHLPVPPLNIQTVNICLSWQPDRKSISPLCQPPHSQQMKVHKSFCVAAESAVMLVNGCDLAWFYFCLAHLWPLSSSHILWFLQAECQYRLSRSCLFPHYFVHILWLYLCPALQFLCPGLILPLMFSFHGCIIVSYPMTSSPFRRSSRPAEEHSHREAAQHGGPSHCPPSTLPTIRE